MLIIATPGQLSHVRHQNEFSDCHVGLGVSGSAVVLWGRVSDTAIVRVKSRLIVED